MASIGVIGSGHTGIAVANELIDRGCRPIILDVGETLDPHRQEIVDRLSLQPKSQWDAADLAEITRNPTIFEKKAKRLAFGSDYIYAAAKGTARIKASEEGPSPTFARGGFSEVWGAAMLPADDCDMADWPIQRDDLVPHYRRVISGLPLSATNDRLSQAFPVYKSNLEAIDLSPAVRSFLDSLSRSRSLNCQDDVLFGQARLAVRPSSNLHGEGCNYCGLCLSGCVYNAIYSANDELARLERAGKVEYRPGHKVLRLKERGDRIEVTCQTAGGSRETIFFDKVFLAAGAINSTRIILASNRAFDRRVIMKTTQGFVIPMLRLRGDPFVWPSANTLAGVFLEFKVPEVSNHWVHSQINLANELVMARLDFQPERGRWRDHVLMPAFKRLFVAICNFHSDHAGTHELVLREATDGGMDSLLIETRASDTFRRVAKRGLRRFVRIMSRVGVLPLIPLMHGSYEKPWGWHFGGTLPMSANPQGDLETDFLGRPTGWTRVHVVDSSVFPSIPATTVALLAMANARRIASTARLDETSDVTVHSASSGRW